MNKKTKRMEWLRVKKKKNKLNEIIFKSYQDAINNRMKAGHDVSNLTKRLNSLITKHS